MEKNDWRELDFSSIWIGYLSDSFPERMTTYEMEEEFTPVLNDTKTTEFS
ncbi:hypothetical protein [Heyndrickxia sporothermodurans]|uniref:Uncharacterized protein n=1 Tax=Heyndrickxia sporothermodurans TaxID=46224 RepID=A0A150LD92_9BACI|nr:hypothetical protein [Heyndrickxia sporothermodurans]KYD10190.1 hypothetical protein B4102_0374 [Heyndrickxia sporothermodurans]